MWYQFLLDTVRMVFPELHDERYLQTFCSGCRYGYYAQRMTDSDSDLLGRDMNKIPY